MAKNLLIVFLLITSSCSVFSADYYCPKSNIFLAQGAKDLDEGGTLSVDMAGVNQPYPMSQKEVGKEPTNGIVRFEAKNCSNEKFKCLEITQTRNLEFVKKFYMFMPRNLELGTEYTFKEMKLVTSISRTVESQDYSRKSPIVQTVLWQKIDGVMTPMKLTLQSGKGVIFWDGLDFWKGRFNSGETCLLQSEQGMFQDVKIKNRDEKAEGDSKRLVE